MKVAIVGFGVEGRSSYDYFVAQGADVTIFDQSPTPKMTLPPGAKLISGPDAFTQLTDFDVVMRVPTVAPDSLSTHGRISSNIKEFLANCPTKNVIGVTATKGKGTITSLIADILRKAGKTVHVAGNIGVPALDVLPAVKKQDVVVLELSSFQLWDIERSPHIAVIGMIEPEHLEVHGTFEDYAGAKGNIARHQTPDDIVIYHPTNQYSRQMAELSSGLRIAYGTRQGAYLEETYKGRYIMVDGERLCSVDDVRIPGEHNLENICAAVTAAWQLTTNREAAAAAVTAFTGLPHRLQLVATVHGIEFYDDSISTTPGSVIAALHAFTPKNTALLIGGRYDKGVDFSGLAAEMAALQPRHVVFVGPIGKNIHDLCVAAGYAGGELLVEWTMPEAVKRAYGAVKAQTGGTVVLSPACASFGDFTDYKDRGDKFAAAAQSLQ